jgi:hypothetical protein
MRPLPVLAISLILGNAGVLRATDETVPPDVQEKLQAIYSMADSNLKNDSDLYKTSNPSPVGKLKVELGAETREPKIYVIQPDVPDKGCLVQVWADGLRLRGVLNNALSQSVEDKKTLQEIPQLSFREAIDRAKAYLAEYHIPLSSDLKLNKVKFNYSVLYGCWSVSWCRLAGGYEWDDFEPSEEGVGVVFHEKRGLYTIADSSHDPPPKSFKVVMTREEAIVKAPNYVPLVERTPFYRMARLDGFVPTTLVSCNLRIVAPNYLLDPKRAAWLPGKVPTETFLCWAVRFSTVDAKASKRPGPGKLIPPDIVIYLDAATGDCVGADFS